MNNPNGFVIRTAHKEDAGLVLDFIRQIAAYEKMADQITATGEILKEFVFEKEAAWVLIGESKGEPVGFALCYENFSTFVGKPGLYLQGLYGKAARRGKGFAKALFQAVAAGAARRGCQRLEWTCLDRNQSSIGFYRTLAAAAMEDWTAYRLSGSTIAQTTKM